jgi:hypothetical protein
MDLNKTISIFQTFSNLSYEEAVEWTGMIESAIHTIKAKLKPDSDQSKKENKSRLQTAAAALSFYQYILALAANGGLNSFSIDGMSVKNDKEKDVKIAKRIWEEALDNVSDLLSDENFMFKSV